MIVLDGRVAAYMQGVCLEVSYLVVVVQADGAADGVFLGVL